MRSAPAELGPAAASEGPSSDRPALPSSAPTASEAAGRLPPVANAPDPFNWSGAALDLTLKLLAVLALAYVSLAALRRYSLGTSLGRKKGRLQVLDLASHARGPHARLGRCIRGVAAEMVFRGFEKHP